MQAPLVFKFPRIIHAAQGGAEAVEELGMGSVIEVAHHQIAFPQQPVAEVHAGEIDFVAIAVQDARALGMHKLAVGAAGKQHQR